MAASEGISTGYVHGVFGKLTNNSEKLVKDFITAHTGTVAADGTFTPSADGTLILSSSESLQLQQLMAEQSIAANLATSSLKSIKDSILAATRNI